MVVSLSVEVKKQLDPIVPWEDITCLLWHNDLLFTTVTSSYNTSTGCNGKINVWDQDLNPVGEFQAHEYAVYHMCAGPEDTFYSCASDSIICHWKCPARGVVAASGEYKLTLLSQLKGHLEPPTRLRYCNDKLFSGDELGEIRLWENDNYKGVLETYEEIWDMIVLKNVIITVRFLDVTLTTLPEKDKKACSVKNAFPGRGPLFVSGDLILCQNRNSFDIMVRSISTTKNPIVKELKGHKALIYVVAGKDSILFSGDYEGRVIAWNLKDLTMITEIWLEGYGCVNAMAIHPDQKIVYVGQEKKCLSKLKLQD